MTENPSFDKFTESIRPALQAELERVVSEAYQDSSEELLQMLSYQLGWTGEGAGEKAAGKQIRPLLVLLTAEAAGGSWETALPAAAAVELLHNFSLIHDDIEDSSELRRGRPTIWKRWGIAQAINTGDAMYSLANLALTRLEITVSPNAACRAWRLFQLTCLQLTQGQHLDLLFETKPRISLDAYWEMVAGKTAALLAFSMQVGAISAGADRDLERACREFGHSLGLAFQAQDDLLGIWGEREVSGKSSSGDLTAQKKTLPVVYGLNQQGRFAARWRAGPIASTDVRQLREMLEAEGAYDYTKNMAGQLTQQALQSLNDTQLSGPAHQALVALANSLLNRTY